MIVPQQPRRTLVALLALVLATAACSSGSSPAASGGGGAGSPAAGGSIDPFSPYPSKAGDLPSVKFAQSVPALSFASLLVARDMNFFGYQGVKLEFVQLQSGATALQGVTGGSIDIVDSASTEVAGAVAQGLDIQAFQNTVMMTLELCVRKDWAQQHNVTADSPLGDRLAALKGATVGITGPGAVSDKGMRFLLSKYGKLNPDTDAKIVQVGGASALPGALDAGQVQAYLLSPPNCGQTTNGMVLVKPSDVPEFANYTHEVAYTTRSWLQGHKDIATAAATAISMGNNFILKYPDKALVLLQKDFSKVDPKVIADGFNATIKPQIKPDGKFDASMWQNTNQVLLDAGIITKPIDTAEGKVWTNEYIGDASVR